MLFSIVVDTSSFSDPEPISSVGCSLTGRPKELDGFQEGEDLGLVTATRWNLPMR